MSVKVSCVEGERVDITIAEYNDLVRASEKIAAVERLFAVNNYVSKSDIMALLGIKEPTEPTAAKIKNKKGKK